MYQINSIQTNNHGKVLLLNCIDINSRCSNIIINNYIFLTIYCIIRVYNIINALNLLFVRKIYYLFCCKIFITEIKQKKKVDSKE